MKIKSRLRRFWRHNKKCVGMWSMLAQVPVILIPPYHFSDIIFVIIAGLWVVVWQKERQIDTQRRLIDIIIHKYIRELIDHRNDLIDAQEELIDAQEELIKERAEHIKCEKEKQELLKQLIELKQQTEKHSR